MSIDINDKLRNDNMGLQQYRTNVADTIEEINGNVVELVNNRPAIRPGTGYNAVIEGDIINNIASSQYSHAEGKNTLAKGENSHAEGRDTIAAVYNQHVEGRGNLEDTKKKYAHILGIGEYENSTLKTRKNGHTIDWYGNAWFAGDARVGGTEYDDSKNLATEEYVDDKIGDIETVLYCIILMQNSLIGGESK